MERQVIQQNENLFAILAWKKSHIRHEALSGVPIANRECEQSSSYKVL